MPTLSLPSRRSSLLSVRAALADRTTRRDGDPPPTDGLADHLRVVIARVLRTGRGPAALVGWVNGQLASVSENGADPAAHLADRLLGRFVPPSVEPATIGG